MEELDKAQKEAIAKMARLCSRSEQCSFDIRKKLSAFEFDETVVDEVIKLLKKENYLNDERYVKAYVNDKFKINRWGRVKMRYYLRAKGFSYDVIENGLDTIDDEKYKELLIKIMESKAKSIKNKEKFLKMGQVIRFAQNRGFEPELIHRYLSSVLE